MEYYSIDNNSMGQQNMTNLHQIFPEPTQTNIPDDYACLHCGKDLSDADKGKRQLVLNRGIYADYLEPEYYRYNKSLKIDTNIDDLGRKYMQYKPRRPKCPIIFNKLSPEYPSSHLIHNPLYNYPINNNIKNIEKNLMSKIVDTKYYFVKNFQDMMDRLDSAKTY